VATLIAERMDKIKTILMLIAVILGGLVMLAGIGLVYSLLNYILVFAVLCLAGYVAVKLLVKPEPKEIKTSDPRKQLKTIQRLLDQYKKDQ
jgi:predicted tellurium resistance membrane protein TerC